MAFASRPQPLPFARKLCGRWREGSCNRENAELKKLEDAGYQPKRNDPSYPDTLQQAQKNAGIGTAASQ